MRSGPSRKPRTRIESPANPWSRAKLALDLARHGDLYAARRCLENLRYHPEISGALFAIYDEEIEARRAERGAAPRINNPADYLSLRDERLRHPFRRITKGSAMSPSFPLGMALPPLVGSSNDLGYLREAASLLAEGSHARLPSIGVVVAPSDRTDLAALGRMLRRQTFQGSVRVVVFDTRAGAEPSLPDVPSLELIAYSALGAEGSERMRRIADEADLVVFLSGSVAIDETLLERAAHLGWVSDALVQPLAPVGSAGPLRTLFGSGAGQEAFASRYPFREMRGLNLVAPAALLRRTGPLDARFSSLDLAARELAFRMFDLGAYFAPLPVPALEPPAGHDASPEDRELYLQLCPNPWDRRADGRFERPRVSVYIPAHNAGRYIEQAVASVLEQDVEDLEVCIADDGSWDGTAERLERLYSDEPRVRWETTRNGGIGFGSNRAIAMARAPYIGQLDADDRLKPGAVRRLMTHLDEHPDVACCYSSCERIDADGAFVENEYSWPVFSREKMMLTSIAHHFRMFRRSAWERTTGFREDIDNAVDYDLFLKLSEVGALHHVDEVLYQRRWHGENTSDRKENLQTTNTHRAQREALTRLGLREFWDVHVPDPRLPRRITYKRVPDKPMTLFWPDYSRSNPYQHLLYGKARREIEICAGDLDAALEMLGQLDDPRLLTFHLHWLNFLLLGVTDVEEARRKVDAFTAKLEKFVWRGGRLVWTVHNAVSHDTPFGDLEAEMSARIARVAHVLHVHSEGSIDEIASAFELPREKVRVSRHGSYVGAYPDFVTRESARAQLGLGEADDVIVFLGQIRPYKGVETLIEVFRRLLAERPNAVLLLLGAMKFDLFDAVRPELTEAERSRIRANERFVDDMEMQLFLRAADIAVYPYRRILTSGSLLLALSFGVPTAVPSVGMTRDVLEGQDAGVLYDGEGGTEALEGAVRELLARKDAGEISAMGARARARAERLDWPSFAPFLRPDADRPGDRATRRVSS